MPYIKPEERKDYDPIINVLLEYLQRVDEKKVDGYINYIFSRILKEIYVVQPSYFNYNRCIGVLECAKLEAYRRWVSELEDKKIQENGDI